MSGQANLHELDIPEAQREANEKEARARWEAMDKQQTDENMKYMEFPDEDLENLEYNHQ